LLIRCFLYFVLHCLVVVRHGRPPAHCNVGQDCSAVCRWWLGRGRIHDAIGRHIMELRWTKRKTSWSSWLGCHRSLSSECGSSLRRSSRNSKAGGPVLDSIGRAPSQISARNTRPSNFSARSAAGVVENQCVSSSIPTFSWNYCSTN